MLSTALACPHLDFWGGWVGTHPPQKSRSPPFPLILPPILTLTEIFLAPSYAHGSMATDLPVTNYDNSKFIVFGSFRESLSGKLNLSQGGGTRLF